jgi:adenosylmethionine-8-amino-7-oxononanoate aminotransferase
MSTITATATSPIWRPFTQMKTAPTPQMVQTGRGAWLELEDGRRVLDCISSWWVTIHGHGEPVIAEAIYEQAKKLEQALFTSFTHEPAEVLAENVLSVVPSNLKRAFFSDNGSTAVEVALKMAYQYWLNKGFKTKNRFIVLDHGYHGDTVGAMSVGQSSDFWRPFKALLFEIDSIPFPATWISDKDAEEKEAESLAALASLIKKSPDSYAAIIVEPLVQGAAGMRMSTTRYLGKLERFAKEHNLLVIYDEVMTGFGRTGDWFACRKANTQPDILCLSKGLTGGFLPMALTLASENIFQAFYDDVWEKAFFHSHSYSGNPITCAAAVASMKLLHERKDTYTGKEQLHLKLIEKYIEDHPRFTRARVCGTIAAFDLKFEEESGYFASVSPRLRARFMDRGFVIRPIGNTIYLLPPYCITREELESAYKIINELCLEENL